MPGYVIHLAVGEEFIKNHPNEIKNYNAFTDGIIYPDSVKDKSLTHYGEKSSMVNLKDFFIDRDLNTDFNKGYFIHILTDYIFYNKFLKVFSREVVHDDYNILNKELEDKFKIKIPAKVKDKVFYKAGKTRILNLEETIEFIKETGKYDLDDIKTAVLNDDERWLKIRPVAEIKKLF